MTETTKDRRDLIVDYIRRGRATQSNVESHFGLHPSIARRILLELELDDKVRQRGLWWEAI